MTKRKDYQLTDAAVKSIAKQSSPNKITRHGDGNKLYLIQHPNSSLFWQMAYGLSMTLGLPEIHVDLAQKSIYVPTDLDNQEEKQFLTVGTTTDEAVATYRYIKSYFTNLCDFAGREMINIGYEELKYIDTGVKFRTVKKEKTIERLHHEIKNNITLNEL
ncbi:hypothetical protein [uncultured Psychrobacter sp.]|uniref:hypothetical protein n=1 Tax=uncultured Psychrobacter sp. TaxID=259303 RepID=UPI0026324ADD|nr:hypothetical protein [uncultured Psychrobacter sp.]